MGFLLFPIWVGGSAWRPFGLPELRHEVSSETFYPSFFHSKFSNKSMLKVHAKSVKSVKV